MPDDRYGGFEDSSHRGGHYESHGSQPEREPNRGGQGYSNDNHSDSRGGYRRDNNQHGGNSDGYKKKSYGDGYKKKSYGDDYKKRDLGPTDPYMSYGIALDKDTPRFVIDDLITMVKDGNDKLLTLRITQPEKGGEDTQELVRTAIKKEKIIPWKGFDDIEDATYTTTQRAKILHNKILMSSLEGGILTISATKINFMLGKGLESPLGFLLIWTPDACERVRDISKETGYLSPLIKIAGRYRIPVINVCNQGWRDRALQELNKYHLGTDAER